MITDETPDIISTSLVTDPIEIHDNNFTIGIEYIGVGRSSTKVHPLANYAIAKMSIMTFVCVSLDDSSTNLAAYFAARSD